MEEKKLTFKERWLLEDTKCEHCGTVIKKQRGITRQNIRRLLIPQWNMNEVLITFMLILVLFLAYSYVQETKLSKEWVKSMFAGGTKESCVMECSNKCEIGFEKIKDTNYLNLNPNATILNDINRSS